MVVKGRASDKKGQGDPRMKGILSTVVAMEACERRGGVLEDATDEPKPKELVGDGEPGSDRRARRRFGGVAAFRQDSVCHAQPMAFSPHDEQARVFALHPAPHSFEPDFKEC